MELTKEDRIVEILTRNGYSDIVGTFGIESTGDVRIFEHATIAAGDTSLCLIMGRGDRAWVLWYKDDDDIYYTNINDEIEEVENYKGN